MAPTPQIIGAALALLIAALLSAAHAGTVTWTECVHPGNRVIQRGSQDPGDRLLNAWRCNITDLQPSDFKNLCNVKEILLFMNKIKHLDPEVFRDVPGVTFLDISVNKLTEFPAFGASSVLPNVETLRFESNRISKLDNPMTFSTLKQLKMLRLSKNQIEYIHPDMFAGLTKLEKLYLDNNKLTQIADKTFTISSLQFINLANNLIENVDSGAFLGSQLKTLNIQNNKLTHLSEDFFVNDGKQLEAFCYYDNPWQCQFLNKITAHKSEKNVSCKEYEGPEPVCSN